MTGDQRWSDSKKKHCPGGRRAPETTTRFQVPLLTARLTKPREESGLSEVTQQAKKGKNPPYPLVSPSCLLFQVVPNTQSPRGRTCSEAPARPPAHSSRPAPHLGAGLGSTIVPPTPLSPGACPGPAVGSADRGGGPALPARRPPLTWPDPAGT